MAGHPRQHMAVVEAQREFSRQRHTASDSPSMIRTTSAASPAAACSRPPGRSRPVSPTPFARSACRRDTGGWWPGRRGRCDPPVSGGPVVQQGREAGWRIEAGQTPPIDGAVPTDQRRRVQVADQAASPPVTSALTVPTSAQTVEPVVNPRLRISSDVCLVGRLRLPALALPNGG